ncbi:MAG: NAD(+) synthase [Betaproteobacteria bacterium]
MGRAERIAGWMRERVQEAGAQGLVVGLSGGVDSALVVRLAQLAAPGAVVGALMPCHSDPQDERDARLVAERFSVPTVRVPLEPAYDALAAALDAAAASLRVTIRPERPHDDPRARVAVANLKPRLRMASLYYLANTLNYLVAGTGNRSELSIGYFTKHGDGGVDLLPLANLVKSEVRAMARALGVPDAVVDRTPSAGLWSGQSDESEMGFSYGDLEHYLRDGPQSVAPAVAIKIERLVRTSEHKRHLPPAPPA